MACYDCDLCGACCRTFPIFASEADALVEPMIVDEAKRLDGSVSSVERMFQLFPLAFHDGCSFLESDNRCRIYATRPCVCRDFQAGSSQCQEARLRQGIAPLLPVTVAAP